MHKILWVSFNTELDVFKGVGGEQLKRSHPSEKLGGEGHYFTLFQGRPQKVSAL